MPRKKETLTLSVPPGTKEQLEAIARRLKIFWGKSPSPSGLVTAIANQSLEIGQPFSLHENQVKALRQAAKRLVDEGDIEESRILLQLLLDRGNLTAPLRAELIKQINQTQMAWRILVEQQISQQQPFCLLYSNSQDTTLEFTVRYAEIIPYEKRIYLQIWCDEIEDSQDIAPLRHNRCLRLDRIQGILPTGGEWRSDFDAIEVQLHFYNWLVKAYEPKPEDVADRVIDGVRQVTRRIINPFWLVRELLRYGKDCELVSPASLRDRMAQEVRSLAARYDRSPDQS